MNKVFRYISPIVLPVIFLITWQIVSLQIANPIALPSLSSVSEVLSNPNENLLSIGSLIKNTWISILRVSIGYIIAAFIAIPLGMTVVFFNRLDRLLMPFLSLFRPIAPLAWVPLVLAWFGVSSIASITKMEIGGAYYIFSNIKLSMIFIIFIGAFFPILTNTVYGVKSVKNILVDSALTLGASKRDIFSKVLLPAALPSIFTGLKVGLGVAWMCLVSAEMLPGSLAGIGYLITHAYTMARTDIVIAGMVSIGLIGGIFDNIFSALENKFFKWQRLER